MGSSARGLGGPKAPDAACGRRLPEGRPGAARELAGLGDARHLQPGGAVAPAGGGRATGRAPSSWMGTLAWRGCRLRMVSRRTSSRELRADVSLGPTAQMAQIAPTRYTAKPSASPDRRGAGQPSGTRLACAFQRRTRPSAC
jgi:hypothetical protein